MSGPRHFLQTIAELDDAADRLEAERPERAVVFRDMARESLNEWLDDQWTRDDHAIVMSDVRDDGIVEGRSSWESFWADHDEGDGCNDA